MNYSNSNLNTLGVGTGEVNSEFASGVDGDVINYQVLGGGANLTNNNPHEEGFYSNAGGMFKNFRKAQKVRQARRTARSRSKNDARKGRSKARNMRGEAWKMRAGAKQTQADAQNVAAGSIGKESQSDIELAKSLQYSTPGISEPQKQPMNKNLKIGLWVLGGLAVVVVGYMAYKKFKK